MNQPVNICAIGDELAIAWDDGVEDYFPFAFLRAKSPSAENQGERDLLGRVYGGSDPGKNYNGVTIQSWQPIGGYALQFRFSDGHNTGLYAYDYLRSLGNALRDTNPT